MPRDAGSGEPEVSGPPQLSWRFDAICTVPYSSLLMQQRISTMWRRGAEESPNQLPELLAPPRKADPPSLPGMVGLLRR